MTIPWLAGLGAALQTGGQDTLEEKQRLRALARQQAQFEAQQASQAAALGEQSRHNAAMEALQRGEQDLNRTNLDRLRYRQEVDDFSQSAGRAGINYLNPRAAYANSQQAPAELGYSGVPDMSPAINALRQANTQSWQKNLDATSNRLRAGNIGVGIVPGSEGVGGVAVENRQFNPYSGYPAGLREQSNYSLDFSRAQDDIRLQGESAASSEQKTATEIEQITDMSIVAGRMEKAREAARRRAAQTWSAMLSNIYPDRAHILSPEALMGQAVSPPAPAQTGAPTTQQPTGGGNPFIQGGAPAPAPRPQVQPRPVGGNPFIR